MSKKTRVCFLYQCNVCGRSYTSHNYFNKHVQIHTEENLYKCEVCNEEFSFHNAYTRHRNMHQQIRNCDQRNKDISLVLSSLESWNFECPKPLHIIYPMTHSDISGQDIKPDSTITESHMAAHEAQCELVDVKSLSDDTIIQPGDSLIKNSLESFALKNEYTCSNAVQTNDIVQPQPQIFQPDTTELLIPSKLSPYKSGKQEDISPGRSGKVAMWYKCEYCNLKLRTHRHMLSHKKKHMSRLHTGVYVCNHCLVPLQTRKLMLEHIQTVHSYLENLQASPDNVQLSQLEPSSQTEVALVGHNIQYVDMTSEPRHNKLELQTQVTTEINNENSDNHLEHKSQGTVLAQPKWDCYSETVQPIIIQPLHKDDKNHISPTVQLSQPQTDAISHGLPDQSSVEWTTPATSSTSCQAIQPQVVSLVQTPSSPVKDEKEHCFSHPS